MLAGRSTNAPTLAATLKPAMFGRAPTRHDSGSGASAQAPLEDTTTASNVWSNTVHMCTRCGVRGRAPPLPHPAPGAVGLRPSTYFSVQDGLYGLCGGVGFCKQALTTP